MANLISDEVMIMEKPAKQGATGCKPLTKFVHTDTDAFREIVELLTGPSETIAAQDGEPTKIAGVKRTTPKLHERRQYMRPKLELVKPNFYLKSGSSINSSFPHSRILGNSSHLPSLTTPSTIVFHLSFHDEEKRKESQKPELNKQQEERAIKERRFYLHPSSRSKPGYTEP